MENEAVEYVGDDEGKELENINSLENLISALGNEDFYKNYNIKKDEASTMVTEIQGSLDLIGVGNNSNGEIRYLGLQFFDSESHDILYKANDLLQELVERQRVEYPGKKFVTRINPPVN